MHYIYKAERIDRKVMCVQIIVSRYIIQCSCLTESVVSIEGGRINSKFVKRLLI